VESFIEEIKQFIGWTASDAELLASLSPRMQRHLPGLAEQLLASVERHPGARRILCSGAADAAVLRQGILSWARSLFGGFYDESYAQLRLECGSQAARAGFEQRYLLAAMANARAYLVDSVAKEIPSCEQAPGIRAVHRILDLDLNLICHGYLEQSLRHLKLLNAELEQSALELAEASLSKDEFVAHVSHELRSPLNAILGFIRLVLDGLCHSQEEEKQVLRDAQQSAQLLLRIVNDLLDLHRVTANKFALKIQAYPLRQLLDATLPLIAVQAAAKDVQIIDETLDTALPQVSTDEVRFRQVLINVLTNAVKFTDHGAVVVRGFPHADENSFCLEVEDTGIGVPAGQRASVFKKFVRAVGDASHAAARDRADEVQRAGAGLGLHIAKRLVELMDGRIGLESGRRGKGSVIWFTVPLAAKAKTQRRASRRKQPAGASA
jgi:signal transduction histidine kinase